MHLPGNNLLHLSTVAHQGCTLLFGIDLKRAIHYSVKLDPPGESISGYSLTAAGLRQLKAGLEAKTPAYKIGARLDSLVDQPSLDENAYLAAVNAKLDAAAKTHEAEFLRYAKIITPVHWSKWQQLPLPHEAEDASVIAREKADGTDGLLRSVYVSDERSAIAPMQWISAGADLHLFRQSTDGTLLVDRFVLDAQAGRLCRKIEVRFKRSGLRHEPHGGASDKPLDGRDFRDKDGKFFVEPSLELRLVAGIEDGRFAVVMTPAHEPGKSRWHIFTWDSGARRLRSTTLGKTEENLFDLRDWTVAEGEPDQPVYRRIPGIVRHAIELRDAQGQTLDARAGLSAVVHDLQREVGNDADDKQSLKVERRVMVTVPVGAHAKVAVVSFGLHRDGSLAPIDAAHQDVLLCEDNEDLGVPANVLSRVAAYRDGLVEAPPDDRRAGLVFDGAAGPHVTTLPAFELTGTSFTIEMWLRRDQLRESAITLAFGHGTMESHAGLHIGYRGNKFLFGFWSNDLHGPEERDQDWHHWACVYTLHGARQLFRDGVKVAEDHPPPYLGSGPMQLGSAFGCGFPGAVADVRVWRRARTGAEIAALRKVRLTGRELGLVANWPLDAIVGGEVLDIVGRRWTAITGASSRSLGRNLADASPATGYRNATLVPVAERCTYVETFELRTDGECGALDVTFWGETVGGAPTAPVRVPATLEVLPDQWTRATARFTVQAGGTSLRCLDFSPPAGSWTRLDVRNHRIERLRGTITESSHVAAVTLTELGPEYAELARIESTLDELEAEEARLAREYGGHQLALDGTPEQKEDGEKAAQAAYDAAKRESDALKSEFEALEQYLFVGSTIGVAKAELSNKFVAYENVDVDDQWVVFTIRDIRGMNYPALHFGDRVTLSALRSLARCDCQILNPADHADRGQIPRSGAVTFVAGPGTAFTCTLLAWYFDIGYSEVHERHLAALDRLSACEAALGLFKQPGDPTARNQLKQKLDAQRAQIADAVESHHVATGAMEDAEMRMPRLSAPGQDLTVQGALLGFACAEATPSAIESVEGAVHLYFSGTEGRLRRCTFDSVDQRWRAEPLGACLRFDSTNNEVIIEDHPKLTSTQFTIELWLRWRGSGSDIHFLTGKGLAELEIHTGGDVPGGLRFLPIPGIHIDSRPGVLRSGEWTHIACVYAGHADTAQIYVDGQRVTHVFVDRNVKSPRSTEPLRLGRRCDGTFALKGDMADVRLWNVALTADEIAAQMHFRLSGHEPGLIGHWPLRTGEGTTARDLSENPEHGTIVGPTWHVSTAPIGRPKAGPPSILEFTGAGAVTIPHQPAYAQPAFTLELKFCWDGSGTQAVIGKGPQELELRILHTARGVTVFEDRAYSGGSQMLRPGRYTRAQLALGDDRVSSLRVPPGYRVTLYDEDAFQGESIQYTADVEFTWGFNDRTSSIVVERLDSGPLDVLRFVPVPGVTFDALVDVIRPREWVHVTCVYTGDPNTSRVHINGIAVACHVTGTPQGGPLSSAPLRIGGSSGGESPFSGRIADVRLWATALTVAQVEASVRGTPTGREAGLVGHWRLDGDANDSSSTANHGTIAGPRFVRDPLIAGEYGSVEGGTGERQALLRRMFAWSRRGGADALVGQRVDSLELRWLGNAQTKPTLVGYIEGAPPVPSENLTVEDDYNGASSVELRVSEETHKTFSTDLVAGFNSTTRAAIGFDASGSTVINWTVRGFAEAFLSVGGSLVSQTGRTEATTVTLSDRLALKGEREAVASMAQLGPRYIPKNVGYASVVSVLTDVFALRTRGSRRLVGYRLVPVDVPPDVNVITFLINPAYTMNGSLDGQVGSNAADSRFNGHVPEARAQAGSAVAASYYRLAEAYALKDAIEVANRRSEAAAINLDARYLDGFKISGRPEAKNDRNAAWTNANNNTDDVMTTMGKLAKPRTIEEVAAATPKGNIVNTYVWDGDGGLRAETRSFTNSWTNVLGGGYHIEAGVGVSAEFAFILAVEFSSTTSLYVTETLTTETGGTRGIELNVDIQGEIRGITDNKDRALVPGEKVDRYRFMSFALQPSTEHFNDFFARVVDPEWLMGDSLEAEALRRIDVTKPNASWRVLHRVTYVERPR